MDLVSFLLGILFGQRGSVEWTVGPVTQRLEKARPKVFRLTTEQQTVAHAAFKTAAGHPARVDGVPVWESDSPAVASVVAAADGLSAVITANGLGLANVTVTADADLGAGVKPIKGTTSFEVVDPDAATVDITIDEPTIKP